MSIGKLIRKRRRALDLTQTQLAEATGFTRVRISEWERGETAGIEARSLVALEKALHFKAGELFEAYAFAPSSSRRRRQQHVDD